MEKVFLYIEGLLSGMLPFILLVFIVVDQPDDYLCVPLLYTIGYCLGGVVALYMIFGQMKIDCYFFSASSVKYSFENVHLP